MNLAHKQGVRDIRAYNDADQQAGFIKLGHALTSSYFQKTHTKIDWQILNESHTLKQRYEACNITKQLSNILMSCKSLLLLVSRYMYIDG